MRRAVERIRAELVHYLRMVYPARGIGLAKNSGKATSASVGLIKN